MSTQKFTARFEWHDVQGITEWRQGVFPVEEMHCIVVIKTSHQDDKYDEYDDCDAEYRTEMAFLDEDLKWCTCNGKLKENEEVMGWAYMHEVVDLYDVYPFLGL